MPNFCKFCNRPFDLSTDKDRHELTCSSKLAVATPSVSCNISVMQYPMLDAVGDRCRIGFAGVCKVDPCLIQRAQL
jgi:hypothetical protein